MFFLEEGFRGFGLGWYLVGSLRTRFLASAGFGFGFLFVKAIVGVSFGFRGRRRKFTLGGWFVLRWTFVGVFLFRVLCLRGEGAFIFM